MRDTNDAGARKPGKMDEESKQKVTTRDDNTYIQDKVRKEIIDN